MKVFHFVLSWSHGQSLVHMVFYQTQNHRLSWSFGIMSLKNHLCLLSNKPISFPFLQQNFISVSWLALNMLSDWLTNSCFFQRYLVVTKLIESKWNSFLRSSNISIVSSIGLIKIFPVFSQVFMILYFVRFSSAVISSKFGFLIPVNSLIQRSIFESICSRVLPLGSNFDVRIVASWYKAQ